MAGIIDIFSGNPFRMVEMTESVQKIDFKPQLLGSLGIFEPDYLRGRDVGISEQDGTLSLIQTSPNGAAPAELNPDTKLVRKFTTTRLAKGSTIYGYEMQGILGLPEDEQLVEAMTEVADRQRRIRDDIELTHENMRMGAINGVVKDADGSTIIDWFSEFGIAPPAEVDFELDDASTKVLLKCHDVRRAMQVKAKGAWNNTTSVHALASNSFYDQFITHASVERTFLNWQAASDLRQASEFGAFVFGNITWHNYRGTDDGTTIAVPDGKVRFFPVGARGVFREVFGSAEFIPYVNKRALDIYSLLVEDQQRGAWVRPEQYSYPLHVCTRPEMLVTGKAS
ncbi:Phage major capsid protein E [Pseudoxanthobacter soli DSM 19599]|uniref:Phage major capsid protein E n=1 Tax=Pseudoxanthobacter soli DSM 19599 TaxID=1123029 RepID=A0A1M7ZLR7_9HYPH|nr:major capsid protein [Pseudoxanthobacter soli]SHO65821.1 Phage major capsid protein E [Pseudoxanthobacter soli DSM 19599]